MFGMFVQAGHGGGPRTLWHLGDELALARRPSGVGVGHADLDLRSRRAGLSPCLPFVLAGRRLLRRGCARCIIMMHRNTKDGSDRAHLEGVDPLRLRCRKDYAIQKEGRLLRTPQNTM